MFKIYGSRSPIFVKTILAAEEMAVPYEVILVDIAKGDQKLPSHLARHPFGKVPALEHNGHTIFESNAIIKYMANVTESPLYPKAPYERAMVDQWMDYFSMQAGRWSALIWFHTCVAQQVFNMTPDQKVIEDNTKLLVDVMPILDKHFAANQWVAGNTVSLADVNAYMLMSGGHEANLNFGDYENYMRWFKEYSSRKAVAAVKKWRQ